MGGGQAMLKISKHSRLYIFLFYFVLLICLLCMWRWWQHIMTWYNSICSQRLELWLSGHQKAYLPFCLWKMYHSCKVQRCSSRFGKSANWCLKWCVYVSMIVVKLARHGCSSPCNTHRWHGFVSDASALQIEDVYEGISTPRCISFTCNGLLKPQKFSSVATVRGKLLYWTKWLSCLFCFL